MFRKTMFLALLLCLLAGFNAKAQNNVRIVEANVIQPTVYDALLYLQNNSVTPDNGTIHIEILGNVTETALPTSPTNSDPLPAFEFVNLTSRTAIKKIEVYPSDMESAFAITMAQQSSTTAAAQPVYRIHFANEAYLEVHHLHFPNRLAWLASSANSGKTSTTDFHDCVFGNEFMVLHTINDYQSSHYHFNANTWTDYKSYCFTNNNAYNRETSVVFNNNTITRFRVVSVFPTQLYRTNVTMTGNIFYHLMDYSTVPGISSSVALCQVTGPINGDYVFNDNKILGIFTKGNMVKAPAIMLQHGANNYQGVMDGSSITMKNNTLQCDIAQFGWKANAGGGYETGDYTQMLKNHLYYNLILPSGSTPQTGNYYADIDDPIKVHMFTQEHDPHNDADMCHVCKACGQMFVHGHAEGTGGLFQYLGGDGNLHNVADAQGIIAKNLPIEKIAPENPDLYQLVEENVVRDGFCLNVGETQDFIITPYVSGAFQSLKLYGGPVSPLDVTSSATTTDGGLTYHYVFTNDFTQANPYMGCPEIVAKFGGNPIWAFHSGASTPYAIYATLGDALNNYNLRDNDVIEFHGNTSETLKTTISKKNITIRSMEGACCTADYGSFNLSTYGSSTQGVITVTGVGLNVSNVVFQNLSNPQGSVLHNVHLFYVNNGATATFGKDCTIQNIQCPGTSNGAAVFVENGTVVADGATLAHNYGMHGAAFYVNVNGILVINDTPDDGVATRLFDNNVRDDGGVGGAISVRGTATITDGDFYGNYGKFGGAISNTGSLTISGGTFHEHVNCPAVVCSDCVYLHVDGNPIFENNVSEYGPAIQIQNWNNSSGSNCSIESGVFRNNLATISGGAFSVRCNQTHPIHLTISGGTFENNLAEVNGGIMDILSGAHVTVTGGTFSGNKADVDKEDSETGRGNAIWQNGFLMVSGNPLFGTDQDVYLVSAERVITKSGDIDASVLIPVSMLVTSEVMGRDILVSSTGHDVVKTDLSRLNVLLENTTNVPHLSAAFTLDDAVTHTPVIELFACLWSEYVVECPSIGYSESDGNVTISSREGLAWLISVVNGLNGQAGNSLSNKTVNLISNVDMTEHIWEAIGTNAHPFQGTFTSNGSTIKGLNNNADYGVAGLFGTVNGMVSNAFVESCNFVANPDAEAYFGIIANTVDGGIVHSSEAMGALAATNVNAHIGGVVGLVKANSEVHSVISFAVLNGNDKGGIVNTLDGSAKLSNSYARFSAFTTSKELVANNSGTVTNCYFVNGEEKKLSDGLTFTVPSAYGYGVSGCMVNSERMVDKLNVWVGNSETYASWAQPFNPGFNGNCPMLKLKDFNTMAVKASTTPYLYYGDMDAQIASGIFTAMLFYGQKDNSTASYSGSRLYIDQNAALKHSGTLQVNAGVVFDNSDHSGFAGGAYDWHMFSTPLTNAPLGIDYSGYIPAGSVYGSPSQVNFTNADGYFPTDTPYHSWDFYCFSEPFSSWINYKRNTGDHYDTYTEHNITASEFSNEDNLILGKGYLAAIDRETVLQAFGTLNNANVVIPVTYEGHHVMGSNFIGNPYHAYLDFDQFCANGNNSVLLASPSYVIIDADHQGYVSYAVGASDNPDQGLRYIHPHQSFIVKVNVAGSLNFTPDQAVVDQTSPYRAERINYPLVNLFVADSDGVRETATAELGRPENGGALKIEGIQIGKCLLSISNQGQRYGIAFMEGHPDEVSVHFHATEDGNFTMRWNTHNGTFSYLHLIDNMTGVDIDCLSQSEYRFTARTTDYASRFKLKFEFTGVEEDPNASTGSENFAFFHQGNLVVNGQGIIELIDLNGRTLLTKQLNDSQNLVTLIEVPEGLYLLRLVNDKNVKTQKIIIR